MKNALQEEQLRTSIKQEIENDCYGIEIATDLGALGDRI